MGFLDTALGGMALGPIAATSSLLGMGGGRSSAASAALLGPMAWGTFGSLFSNYMNIELAREQMSWQEEMANTAHQREVRDLVAAGLNPLLSVNAGAVTPNYQRAEVENPVDSVFRGLSSAVQAARVDSEVRLLETQADQAEASVQETYSRDLKNQTDAFRASEEAKNVQEVRKGIVLDNAAKAAKLPGLKVEGDIDSTEYGQQIRKLQRLMDLLQPAADIGSKARR